MSLFFRIQLPPQKRAIHLAPTQRLSSFIQPFIIRHKSVVIFYMMFVFLASVTGGLIPYFIKVLVDHVELNTAVNTEFIQQFLFITGLIVASRFVSITFWFFADTSWANLVMRLTYDVRMSMTDYLHRHSAGFFERNLSGDLSQKINETADAVKRVCEIIILHFGYAFLRAAVAIVMMFVVHIYLGIASSLAVLGIIVAMFFIGRYVEKYSELKTDLQTNVSGHIVDSVANALLVKLFSARINELHHLNQKSYELMAREKHYYRIIRNSETLKLILETVLFLTCFITAVTLYIYDMTTFGTVIMGFSYGMGLMDEMYGLSDDFIELSENVGRIRSGMKTILVPTKIKDKAESLEAKISMGTVEYTKVKFSYNDGPAVLGDPFFTLVIPSKQKLAVIGPSGAGKSTLVSLLLRFYDVDDGAITIDGQDIRDVTQESLRQNIAVIPQDTSLFHRSLMDNIRYGRLGGSDEEVIAAAKKAYAHDFIMELPDGYDTLVGERGVKLSGGQRQRIAVARAILKDAPILILDEATSSLDSESEQAIQDALKEVMKDKTVIAIAHRLSTIAHMDRIVVMDKGHIIEDGTHAQLVKKKGGLYARLWKHQSGGFIGLD